MLFMVAGFWVRLPKRLYVVFLDGVGFDVRRFVLLVIYLKATRFSFVNGEFSGRNFWGRWSRIKLVYLLLQKPGGSCRAEL